MRRATLFTAALVTIAMALATFAVGPAAHAQVTGLYYKEVEKDGRIYVFNTPERYASWEASGDMGTAVTLIGRGPNGETIVAENETAMDLYLFKHNLEAYERPTPKPAAPAAYPSNKLGIRVYADATSKSNKDQGTGVKSGDSGVGIDVKRTYFTFTHEFDKVWSALFQSDIGEQGQRRFDVFVKKAYVQAKLSDAASFRLGAADTAWIPFVEGIYGMRYFEQTITDHLSFGSSADWGFHFTGKAVANKLSYYVSAENGRGFGNPGRSKTVDFEGRVGCEPIKGLNLAVGGYSGKRGQETDAAPAKHTATRGDALVAYSTDRFRVGAEYFQAKNWNQVTLVPKDKADGFSTWAQFKINPMNMVFARYDNADPSKDLKPQQEFTYYHAGFEHRFNKAMAAALGWKHAEVEGGTLSTGNGTIGSNVRGRKGKYDEIGVWAVYDF
jgi:hypothetical protein